MKGFRKYILLFILQISVVCSLAQMSKIDSLLILLKTDNPDTNKLLHLNKLSGEYVKFGSYDSAMLYANSALQLSNIILEEAIDPKILLITKNGEASSYIGISNIYIYQGNYPEALKNFFASLKIRESIGDKKGVASSYIGIGNVYYSQGNYPEVLKNYFASLKIYEAIGNKSGVAISYNNIGNVYYNQGNYPEALKKYLACLEIIKIMGDKAGIAASYSGIGLVYFSQGNYPEALKNHYASLKIKEAIGDKAGIAISYINIGNIYLEQAEREHSPMLRANKLELALKDYFSSLKIEDKIGDKKGVAASYINIGIVFTKQKKYNEADEYLVKAKELSKKIGYKEYLKNTFSGLTELDSAKGNYKGAYENHKLYILYRDSLDNEESRKKTIQSQMNYDFEKKEAVVDAEHKKELENQKVLAEEKSRKQKMVLLLVSGFLLLILVFAGFIFRSLRLTRKQKMVIEEQKHMVEEKQNEILGSIHYARRIQRSLLPTEKYIDKSLTRLLPRTRK